MTGVVPAPPPSRFEVAPPPPGPRYVWVPGYWRWRPRLARYVWAPGRYVIPPYPNYVWVPGRWVRRGGGYYWVEGQWRLR
jgi:YXWGXW repeat-containing protein